MGVEQVPEQSGIVRIPDEVQKIGQEIEALIDTIASQAQSLETNYVRLGSLLLTIRNDRLWVEWGHHSFGSYIQSIRGRIGTGRTQIYQTLSVVDRLLPIVGEESLQQIGKSKANELCRMVKNGNRPSDDLIAKARDPQVTIETIRELAFAEMHGEPPPQGTHYYLCGFYVTPDERKEIDQAFEVAKLTDPCIANDVPETIQVKEALLRMCREYYGTWYPIVHGSHD